MKNLLWFIVKIFIDNQILQGKKDLKLGKEYKYLNLEGIQCLIKLEKL